MRFHQPHGLHQPHGPYKRTSLLSEVQKLALREWIDEMSTIGFHLPKSSLVSSVKHMVRDVHLRHDHVTAWCDEFLMQHSKTRPKMLDRDTSTNFLAKNKWFHGILPHMEGKRNDPSRILNVDDFRFFVSCMSGNKVCLRREDQHNVTALVAVRADGIFIQPFITWPLQDERENPHHLNKEDAPLNLGERCAPLNISGRVETLNIGIRCAPLNNSGREELPNLGRQGTELNCIQRDQSLKLSERDSPNNSSGQVSSVRLRRLVAPHNLSGRDPSFKLSPRGAPLGLKGQIAHWNLSKRSAPNLSRRETRRGPLNFQGRSAPLNLRGRDAFEPPQIDSDSVTEEQFHRFVKSVLHPNLVRERTVFPVVLFVDRGKSYMSWQLTKFCKEKNIVILPLVEKFEPSMWPCKKSVLRHIGATNALRRYRSAVADGDVAYNEIMRIPREEIQAGFRESGLCPFDATHLIYNWVREPVDLKSDPSFQELTGRLNNGEIMCGHKLPKFYYDRKMKSSGKKDLENLSRIMTQVYY